MYILLDSSFYVLFAIRPDPTRPDPNDILLKSISIISSIIIIDTMDAFRKNNIPMITLDVRISCDTFWNYNFNIPIRINDYYSEDFARNNRNINNGHHGHHGNIGGGGAAASDTCEIGNIGRSDPMFIQLETYLVDYVIQYIYDDLIQKRQQRDIPILLKKARKFHIHGRTLEDLLFPRGNNINTRDEAGHSMPENTVYICTHC